MRKRYIQKARKERLSELKHLLSEAKSFSILQENKKLPVFQKKANQFISEYYRISRAYAALLMLEFYEKGTKETIGVLKNIQSANTGNEIGAFLSGLQMDKFVQAMDAITSQEENTTKAAGGFKAGSNMAHAGYGSGGFSGNLGPGVGSFRAVEEAMINELFGFGTKKAAVEPYQPTGNVVRSAQGDVVGKLGPAQLTTKGQAAQLTQDREHLMAQYQKEMPKVVSFIDAYLAVFKEENKQILKSTKKGMFGGSPAASLIQKEFGKVPGFEVKIFLEEISEDPKIIDINIAKASSANHFEALTSLEDAAKKVQARMNKSVGSRLVDMFSSFGGGSSGIKTMFETSN